MATVPYIRCTMRREGNSLAYKGRESAVVFCRGGSRATSPSGTPLGSSPFGAQIPDTQPVEHNQMTYCKRIIRYKHLGNG